MEARFETKNGTKNRCGKGDEKQWKKSQFGRRQGSKNVLKVWNCRRFQRFGGFYIDIDFYTATSPKTGRKTTQNRAQNRLKKTMQKFSETNGIDTKRHESIGKNKGTSNQLKVS